MTPGVSAEDFERRYLVDPDPWNYETSAYERAKYERTLEAVGAAETVLELGCANGAFTSLLAERCGRLLAVDFSREAVRLAGIRVGSGNVTVVRRDLRRGLPGWSFDAIVCSELLYYWEPTDVRRFCGEVQRSLAAEGVFVAVHWRGNDPASPLDGDTVHEILGEELDQALSHDASLSTDDYRLDRWQMTRGAVAA